MVVAIAIINLQLEHNGIDQASTQRVLSLLACSLL
jgi:hypothetical protein